MEEDEEEEEAELLPSTHRYTIAFDQGQNTRNKYKKTDSQFLMKKIKEN
jgi:hypothetical protein